MKVFLLSLLLFTGIVASSPVIAQIIGPVNKSFYFRIKTKNKSLAQRFKLQICMPLSLSYTNDILAALFFRLNQRGNNE
jgi:hypothetical protein